MKRRKKNPVGEMIRLRAEARDHLTRASVLLLDWHAKKDNLPVAMVYIALAMLRLCQSDENCEAQDRSHEILMKHLAPPPRPRVPGPYSGT